MSRLRGWRAFVILLLVSGLATGCASSARSAQSVYHPNHQAPYETMAECQAAQVATPVQCETRPSPTAARSTAAETVLGVLWGIVIAGGLSGVLIGR